MYLEMVGEGDEEALGELEEKAAWLDSWMSERELARMLSGPEDEHDAIITVHAGAGGTEAQDWAEMLLRMYLRWAERRGFKTEILDILEGAEAGIKTATVAVRGPYAFGYLRAERGVHRLVRISPFDASARRHTSFGSLGVIPEIDEDVSVDIDDDDLRVETYRASGAGGQHVNRTDSAIRITHLPSKIVVQCQNERSQHKNRATAMRLLKSRLLERERQAQAERMEKLAGAKSDIDFGSQIRSYVLQPYQMVKDLRTGVEVGNVDAVLDGDLDRFIEAFLIGQAADGSVEEGTIP